MKKENIISALRDYDEPVSIGDYAVQILRDEYPTNPFEDWDGHAPMVALLGRDGLARYDGGSDIRDPLHDASESWVSRHWRALCDIMGLDKEAFDSECREAQKDWHGKMPDIRKDILRESLSDMRESDRLDSCAAIWNLMGSPSLCSDVQGYCQSHWSRLLIVWTPEFIQTMGVDPRKQDAHKDMQGQANLYECWAYGDVYGYCIEDQETGESESCWGFYCRLWDSEESAHLFENIADTVLYMSEAKRKKKQNRVKTMVRNRVPLLTRQSKIGV